MPEPQKFGVLNKTGWAAYARNGLLFVKRMKYEEGATYPDYNCSVEVFTEGGFIELESLGPMRTLKPGETAEHTERWIAAQRRERRQDRGGSRSRDRVSLTRAKEESEAGRAGSPAEKTSGGPSRQGEVAGGEGRLDFLLRPHVRRPAPSSARRIVFGVISTSSSSLMNSIACSRLNLRGGIRRIGLVGGRRAHVRLLLFLRRR